MKVMRGLTNGIMCPKIIRSSISVILYDIYSKYLIILQSDPGRKKGLTFLQTVKFSNVLNISKVTLLKTCSHCKKKLTNVPICAPFITQTCILSGVPFISRIVLWNIVVQCTVHASFIYR